MLKKLSLILLFSLLLANCGVMEPTADPNIIKTLTALPTKTQSTGSTPTPVTTSSKVPGNPTEKLTSTKVPGNPTLKLTSTPQITATNEFTPTESWTKVKGGNVTAPILVYSNIADSKEDDLYYQTNLGEAKFNITSRQFEQEIMALSDLGYTSITVAQLTDVIRNGGLLPPRPVVITFDNDKLGIYNHAYPILKKYGFLGTIYVVVQQLDGDGFITTSQLKEMADSGWEVGSRSMTGQSLISLYKSNVDLLGNEINGSKTELEKILGIEVTSFSYPDRAVDRNGEITTRVREWGYQSAVVTLNSADHSTSTLYFLSRYEIKNNLSLYIFTSFLPWKVSNKRISATTITFGTPPPDQTSNPGGTQAVIQPLGSETPTP